MGSGKRRCIRGIASSWPAAAAAALQAAEVFALPAFCQHSPHCASLQHHEAGRPAAQHLVAPLEQALSLPGSQH